MTALKVGDRVHVEFDGAVSNIYSGPTNIRTHIPIGVETEGVQRIYTLPREWVTKLPDPEPDWREGDVILVGGELVLTFMALGHAEPLCWAGFNGDKQHRTGQWVSEQWQRGDVQRLVPEVTS